MVFIKGIPNSKYSIFYSGEKRFLDSTVIHTIMYPLKEPLTTVWWSTISICGHQKNCNMTFTTLKEINDIPYNL